MTEPQPEDEVYLQMKSILKPMLKSALKEMPKDPVRKNIIYI